jgi:hypothetical protein
MGLLYNSATKAAEGSLCFLADGTIIDIGMWSFHANINTWSLCVNEGRNERTYLCDFLFQVYNKRVCESTHDVITVFLSELDVSSTYFRLAHHLRCASGEWALVAHLVATQA